MGADIGTESAVEGVIFKFQRHALHDGPGIRTLVFFKGCPLRCPWCFNPESQTAAPEVMHQAHKCLGCDRCVQACPVPGAIATDAAQRGTTARCIDRDLCTGCGLCADACPAGAMTRIGERLDVDTVVDRVLRDKVFYDRSGGGVTLSGGEVTQQSRFASEILRRCRAAGLHTAIETCGHCAWAELERLLAHTDLVLYDLKLLDAQRHRTYTGVLPDTILENARRVAYAAVPMVIRIPIVPGYTDADADLADLAAFVRAQLPAVQGVHLLPYETLGVAKYAGLGRMYALDQVQVPTAERLTEISSIFTDAGLSVQMGG